MDLLQLHVDTSSYAFGTRFFSHFITRLCQRIDEFGQRVQDSLDVCKLPIVLD